MSKSAVHPLLILGLGTGSKQLMQSYEPSSAVNADLDEVRISTPDTYSTVLDGCDFDREALQALVDTADKVLLVVCAGGKAGSAMTLFSAEYAIRKKIPIDVLMSTPFSWEGRRRTTAATTLADGLRAMGVKVSVLEGDQFCRDDLDWKEMFMLLDGAMLSEVNRWIGLNL